MFVAIDESRVYFHANVMCVLTACSQQGNVFTVAWGCCDASQCGR